ncbi:hypothetical protein E8E12_011244 [Didymella heteroderae]|uniref:Uncharacterized protein n=1 Tax=Didymella heteroderae TaxID=1769908 RepID=A0A9P4X278_9PLEO|nr:hypothetical protein E8E12_011244 [Didymella heteroderae]
MRITLLSLSVNLAFAFAISAAPLDARQDALKPFEVTAAVYNNYNGRPGSYPWTRIRANVTDPNSYTFTEGSIVQTVPAGIQGVDCLAQWYIDEYTEGRTYPCDRAEQGHWAIQVYAGTQGEFWGSDFKLKFIHVVEPGLMIQSFRGKIEGEAFFTAGVNGTMSYSCSSSGSCGAGLRSELKPLLVPVKRTL